MKRGQSIPVVVATLFAVGLWPCQLAFADLNYEIVDLGILPDGGGSFSSAANSINENGQVVGMARTAAGDTHAFLWDSASGMIDLGTLGGDRSEAFGINNHGQVVGKARTVDGVYHAFTWDSTNGMADLGTLTGTGISEAKAINDLGQVAGVSVSGWPRAVLWENGSIVDLGDLGGPSSGAWAMNNLGQIAGVSYRDTSGRDYGFIWEDDIMTDLGTTNRSDVFGLNDYGQVVGTVYGSDDWGDPFMWQDGDMTILPSFGGVKTTGRFNRPNAINDRGEIVGFASNSSTNANYNAVLWADGTLPIFHDRLITKLLFNRPNAINDRGEIVGFASNSSTNANYNAVLWADGEIVGLDAIGQSLGGSSANRL